MYEFILILCAEYVFQFYTRQEAYMDRIEAYMEGDLHGQEAYIDRRPSHPLSIKPEYRSTLNS
jgi:hypothetical protein